MTVNVTPKQLTDHFFPGLGEQHVIGAAGVGIQAVDTTIASNTVKTDAQLIAAPNNNAGLSYGPVLHSLGIAPSIAFAMLKGDVGGPNHSVTLAYITADNSAVYIRARSQTGATGNVAVRVVVIR